MYQNRRFIFSRSYRVSKMPNFHFFLHFWPFGYSIWPWKNKSMCFKHILKVAQLSTVLITIWTSTFHRFSQGQICGQKGQLTKICLNFRFCAFLVPLDFLMTFLIGCKIFINWVNINRSSNNKSYIHYRKNAKNCKWISSMV